MNLRHRRGGRSLRDHAPERYPRPPSICRFFQHQRVFEKNSTARHRTSADDSCDIDHGLGQLAVEAHSRERHRRGCVASRCNRVCMSCQCDVEVIIKKRENQPATAVFFGEVAPHFGRRSRKRFPARSRTVGALQTRPDTSVERSSSAVAHPNVRPLSMLPEKMRIDGVLEFPLTRADRIESTRVCVASEQREYTQDDPWLSGQHAS